MSTSLLRACAGVLLGIAAAGPGACEEPQALAPMAIDRRLEILPSGDPRTALAAAAAELDDWTLELAGVAIDEPKLRQLASPPEGEPLLRHVRETLRRPVDLQDFILWLDDVLVAGRNGRRGERFVVPSGRARSAGILLHPDDVFREMPRRYAIKSRELDVDEPREPQEYPPAADGEPLGPRWTARYPNPATDEARLAALREARPDATLASRIASLIEQLQSQGAEVWLTSTVRSRERGYLMWGALLLSTTTDADMPAAVARLERANEEWKLNVPIDWSHDGGAQATREAARRMADAYGVVYATERGARNSSHYTGVAVDLVALALPRQLVLRPPQGSQRTFDLSAPESSRDLSLESDVIAWVERSFGLRKLTSDYPHWTDQR